MKKDKRKSISAEAKATKERQDKVYARVTEHGDPQCDALTFGLVSDEVEIEENNDWITFALSDPEQTGEPDQRYTTKVNQIIGYCVGGTSKGEPFFAVMLKHMPRIVLDMWNHHEAAAVYDRFHDLMQAVAQREPE